jgi:protein subunit release factor A
MEDQLENSIRILREVCAAFTGNLSQHENIQKALRVIETRLAHIKKEEENAKN